MIGRQWYLFLRGDPLRAFVSGLVVMYFLMRWHDYHRYWKLEPGDADDGWA